MVRLATLCVLLVATLGFASCEGDFEEILRAAYANGKDSCSKAQPRCEDGGSVQDPKGCNVAKGSAPFIVAIEWKKPSTQKIEVCTATAIDSEHVLAVVGCLFPTNESVIPTKDITIVAGVTSLRDNAATRLGIKDTHVGTGNNTGLFLLQTLESLPSDVQPICLLDKKLESQMKFTMFSFWNNTNGGSLRMAAINASECRLENNAASCPKQPFGDIGDVTTVEIDGKQMLAGLVQQRSGGFLKCFGFDLCLDLLFIGVTLGTIGSVAACAG